VTTTDPGLTRNLAPSGEEVEAAVANRLPRLSYAFARRHGVLAGERGVNGCEVFYRSDTQLESLLELRRFLGCAIVPRLVDTDDFGRRLRQAYERGGGAAETMDDLGEALDLGQIASALAEPEDLLETQDDAPIIRLINALLTEALNQNASDVHIEPFEGRLAVRLRIDGVLREVLSPPKMIAPLLVSRVKVMANLDIAERRLPQDGRISLRIAGRPVDVRVSTIPTGHGERVVLRLLDKGEGRLDLEQLGMARETRDEIDRLIHRPHGILLVTGPTGSGKTTTLYAALTRLNDTERNMMTVEDPIEYYLDGISQTQVNTKVDMSFARGLRAILRQDPDVVMVGEIRDLETVQIAIQASLTGHMVLSTLHTNSAVGAITRLRDMGVEPFLLSSSLMGALAQRLVRRLCPKCREPYRASEIDCEELAVSPDDPPVIYRHKGCNHCSQLGYRGRYGVFELVLVDEPMRTLIHDGAGEQELERLARARTPSILQDGRRRVLAGDTTLEEMLRVLRED
jgi:general secretion pathway protein E